MKKENELILNWNIYNSEISEELRYCHNCGKKVVFTDSLKRRQNANGKDIYYFAIYKCDKGHSWNKRLNQFKTIPGLENNHLEQAEKETSVPRLCVNEMKSDGIQEIKIMLDVLEENVRIDKFLSDQIKDQNRNEIVNWIESGLVKINDSLVKKKTKVRENDVVTILLK